MPLHEYRCNTCTRSYETIESADSPKEIPCEFFTDGKDAQDSQKEKLADLQSAITPIQKVENIELLELKLQKQNLDMEENQTEQIKP